MITLKTWAADWLRYERACRARPPSGTRLGVRFWLREGLWRVLWARASSKRNPRTWRLWSRLARCVYSADVAP